MDLGCPEEEQRKYHISICPESRRCTGSKPHKTERQTDDMPAGNTHDRIVTRWQKVAAANKHG